MGECLNLLFAEYWFCIRLQFVAGLCPAYRVLHCKTRGLYYRREVLLAVGLFELKLASGLWQSPATGCRGIKTGKNNVPSACVMPDLQKGQELSILQKRPYSEIFCLFGLTQN